MSAQPQLRVTSHVARDLLASAASFKTEAVVVWEYVVNSLQYVDAGVSPRVQVSLSPESICIADNGRGMSAADLQHFFKMHGENRDRILGRGRRGKFGTGKAAAFGIANTLIVDTTRDGKRNVVALTREMIERSKGDGITVEWRVREERTDASNGTAVLIGDLNVPRVKRAAVIEYIERHLQAFRASQPAVAVDDHVCAYREPDAVEQHEFSPTEAQKALLGDCKLKISVAPAPLPESEQGIAVTAGIGNLVAIETAGVAGKEFGNYLFGEVDVPLLERHPSPIQPYDPTRSLQLNPQHPVVAALLGFLGARLEEVRAGLVSKAKDARRTEQARRLAMEAGRIAEILNADFRQVSERLQEIRAASSRNGSALSGAATRVAVRGEQAWVQGTDEPGTVAALVPRRARPDPPPDPPPQPPRPDPEIRRPGIPDQEGKDVLDRVADGPGRQKRTTGGFRVEYTHLGPAEQRSRYDPVTLTIHINLDHPLVAAGLGQGSVEDVTFRRLSYEIAFSEYAMGLGYEISRQDPNIAADDLLYEVRTTLNRVSTAAVALYR